MVDRMAQLKGDTQNNDKKNQGPRPFEDLQNVPLNGMSDREVVALLASVIPPANRVQAGVQLYLAAVASRATVVPPLAGGD